jgi:hypothetical protein
MFQPSRKFTNSEDECDLDKPISLCFQNNNTYFLDSLIKQDTNNMKDYCSQYKSANYFQLSSSPWELNQMQISTLPLLLN